MALRSASESKEGLSKEDLLKQIEGFRTMAGDQLPEEVRQALDKMVGSVSASQLRHAHITRADRAKRAYFQERKLLMELDAEWKALVERLTTRLQGQLKGYRKQREESFKRLTEKKRQWDEARQAIEDVVTTAKEEGEEDLPDPETIEEELDDMLGNWNKMTQQGTITLSDDEEDMEKERDESPIRKKANATGTKARRVENP